jgi:hypothetical protein
MMRKLSFLLVLFCLATLPLFAQRRGSGGMQGGQGHQGMPGMQRGQNQSPTMGGQMGQQDRQRMRIHATSQQQTQYRTCTQSMDRVRSQIREMARASNGKTMNRQQMQQLHQQLRSELQSMQQTREQLMTGFDDEQKTAVQNRAQNMIHTQSDLDYFSDALGFELNQAELNTSKIREHVRKMEHTAQELQQEQRDMARDAGIQ